MLIFLWFDSYYNMYTAYAAKHHVYRTTLITYLPQGVTFTCVCLSPGYFKRYCTDQTTDLKNRTGLSNSLLWWTGFETNWRPSWKDHPKLGVCKQIILWGFWNRFRMQPMFLSTTPNINITKLFCELHSMLLLLPTAAILKGPPAVILEISVASEQRRGKLL